MREQITNYVQTCPKCQQNKRKWTLTTKKSQSAQMGKMSIDLIGPYKIQRNVRLTHHTMLKENSWSPRNVAS